MDRRLPDSASVVVVGGGVMGLSTAYHLARAGVRDVVLVERDDLGAGSTSRAAGGVRTLFSDALNIELGRRSLYAFERFPAEMGQEIDLHRVGYLFLLDRPEDVTAFERSTALQAEQGIESRMVDVAEAQRLSPMIRTEGLLAAAWSPGDGHCTPESVVLGYAGAARRAGARILTRCEVIGIRREGRVITAVETPEGVIPTDTVVCCAGAWSGVVGDLAGVPLPVTPLARQVFITEPVPGLDDATPFTIDFTTSLYFHREGPGLLLGSPDPDTIGEAIAHRAPALGDLGISSGWTGLYEMTPDHNALVGEAQDVERFLYATGFSGHGFLMGPAIGEVMRDLYLGVEPAVDIGGLDAHRFHRSAVRPELNIV